MHKVAAESRPCYLPVLLLLYCTLQWDTLTISNKTSCVFGCLLRSSFLSLLICCCCCCRYCCCFCCSYFGCSLMRFLCRILVLAFSWGSSGVIWGWNLIWFLRSARHINCSWCCRCCCCREMELKKCNWQLTAGSSSSRLPSWSSRYANNVVIYQTSTLTQAKRQRKKKTKTKNWKLKTKIKSADGCQDY